MFCRQCGFKLSEGDRFCANCGVKVQDFVQEFAPNAQEAAVLLPSVKSEPSDLIQISLSEKLQQSIQKYIESCIREAVVASLQSLGTASAPAAPAASAAREPVAPAAESPAPVVPEAPVQPAASSSPKTVSLDQFLAGQGLEPKDQPMEASLEESAARTEAPEEEPAAAAPTETVGVSELAAASSEEQPAAPEEAPAPSGLEEILRGIEQAKDELSKERASIDAFLSKSLKLPEESPETMEASSNDQPASEEIASAPEESAPETESVEVVAAAPVESVPAEEAISAPPAEIEPLEGASEDTDQLKRFMEILNGSEASAENSPQEEAPAAEPKAEPKKKGGFLRRFFLSIVGIVLVGAIALGLLLTVGRNTSLGKSLSEQFAGISNLIYGRASASESSATQDESEDPVTATNTLIGQSIQKKLALAPNIKSVKETPELRFNVEHDYGVEGILDAITYDDDLWYINDVSENVHYTPELVGFVMQYYSKLNDRMNHNSTDVLQMIIPKTKLLGDVSAIKADPVVVHSLDLLEIGEIRRAGTEFYIMVRLTESTNDGHPSQSSTKVLHIHTTDKTAQMAEIVDAE